MRSRNEYLKELWERYQHADKKQKGMILDEYVRNTNHHRKYVILKLNAPNLLDPLPRKPYQRKNLYGHEIVKPLKELWEIFDFLFGARLKPAIQTELTRLRALREIHTTDRVAKLLMQISPATIDRLLKNAKKNIQRRRFTTTRPGTLLKSAIAVRLTDWDTTRIGYVEMDLVAHCGGSAYGEFGNTLSVTDIASGWWEGEAILGKSQQRTFEAFKRIRERLPFPLKGIDSDNGGEFINHNMAKYCQEEGLEFTRSRPSRKNDNAYIEEKNWTHVRKVMGYMRHDTEKELFIINDLYRNELGLYKNFFQPVMKLKRKERIGGKLKRQYEVAKAPYQRVLESKDVPMHQKRRLRLIYNPQNPAELKRQIDRKLWHLYQVYEAKKKSQKRQGGEQKGSLNHNERRFNYG